ncbi:MAG: hypothetical protein ABIS35_15420 [Terracoccus sp.]
MTPTFPRSEVSRHAGAVQGITSGPLAVFTDIDLNYVGYAIVALFVLTWIIAISVWKFARIEKSSRPNYRATLPLQHSTN